MALSKALWPSTSRRIPRIVLIAIGLCGAAVFLSSSAHTQGGAQASTSSDPALQPLLLAPGQIHAIAVADLKRVAIGDPEVADITVVSASEVLIQAKKAGSTTLILWDAQGRRQTTISVVDPTPKVVSERLTQIVRDLNVPSVSVRLEGRKVFLVGEVETEEQLGILEQMAAEYHDVVVTLVRVKPPGPAVVEMAPLVKLSVQIVELSRKDVEKLGVTWDTGVTVTEEEMIAGSMRDTLLRIGQTVTRGQLAWTINALVSQNRARVLSEPKLVTTSGKQASSFIGVEVPIIQATSFGTDTSSVGASITFRQTGVLLTMTPTVHVGDPERRITTILEAEISDIDASVGLSVPVGTQTITVPGFKVRKATTEVTTASGEAIIIAGLLDIQDSEAVSQVPWLGSIPLLGRLFRFPDVSSTRTELIITVTPELLRDEEEAEWDRSRILEQALAVAEVTAPVDDPRLRYALQIQQGIAQGLRYPQREKELGVDGTVKLRLHLFADGALERVMVAESSGVGAFDMEAIRVARAEAPYPAFPSQLSEEDFWLEIPVIFRP